MRLKERISMDLIKTLRCSEYKINISDIGLDLVFSNSLLSEGGLSSTIQNVQCDNYNNIVPPDVGAVSLENVMQRINSMRDIYGTQNGHINIAISGANYSPNKRSHAWIGIGMKTHNIHLDVYYHVTLPYEPNTMDRARTNLYFANIFRNLLDYYISGEKISPKTLKSLGVDGVYDERYSIEDLTNFVIEKGIGVVSHFKDRFYVPRTEDILRLTAVIYRGSFNPPTKFHIEVISKYGALVELTTKHFEKDLQALIPMHHRVKMLLFFTPFVLISNVAKFQELDDSLQGINKHDYIYLLGSDVYDKVDPKDPVFNRLRKVDPDHYRTKIYRATDYRNTNNSEIVSPLVHKYMNKRLEYFKCSK